MKKHIFILLMWTVSLFAQNTAQVGEVDLIPGINRIAITAEVVGDQNFNTEMQLKYRLKGNDNWRNGHPMSRISVKKFAGSVFRLPEDKEIEIKLILQDPDGGNTNDKYFITQKTNSAEISNEATGVKIYVAPKGRDTNPGSKSSPLKTIQKAVEQAQPGDEIHVLSGVYKEYVRIEKRGQAGKYIRVIADGQAILDGSARGFELDAIDNWSRLQNSDIYQTPAEWEPGYVYADSQQLFRYNNLDELHAMRVGAPGGWVHQNQTLYVALTSRQDPDEVPMQISQLEAAFYLKNVAYVSLEGFEIRYYGNSVYGKGIYLRNVSNCVIRNNRIHQVYTGIWLKGTSDFNLIESNYLWDTAIYTWPWSDVKGSYHEGAAISLEGRKGNIVRKNEIEGFFNGITVAYWDDLQDPSMNQGVVVSNNKIHHILDDCVEPEGTCSNLLILDNEMYESTVGVSLAPITLGPVFVIRNTISDFQLTSFKFSSNTTGPCFLYHNTAITTKENTNGIVSSGPWENITFKNNIIAGTCYAIEDHELSGSANFDYDNLYTTDPARFVKWKNTRYYSTKEFFQGAFQEEHGISESSRFVDAWKRDFSLQGNSPNIDRGVIIPNVNDDFLGSAPDIGAFEYGTTAVNPFAEKVPSTTALLLQNYPNPFNNQMIIIYNLPQAAAVKLAVYNSLGQLVDVLVEQVQTKGNYQVQWGPENQPSGVYWLQLQAGSARLTRSVTLLK